jgi:hypothetical protein
VAILGVDAKYVANGEIMIGTLDDADFISGPHITLNDYSQVSAGPHRLGEAARKQLIIHPNSKPPAGDSRLGNLKNCGPDLPSLADERVVHLHSFRREVFAKLAIGKRPTDLLFPPLCVFDCVGVNRFVGSSVCFSIRLIVSGKIDTPGCDPAGDR